MGEHGRPTDLTGLTASLTERAQGKWERLERVMRLVTRSENPRATVSFFALWSSGSTSPGARWSSCRAEQATRQWKAKLGALSISRDAEDLVLELETAAGVVAEV